MMAWHHMLLVALVLAIVGSGAAQDVSLGGLAIEPMSVGTQMQGLSVFPANPVAGDTIYITGRLGYIGDAGDNMPDMIPTVPRTITCANNQASLSDQVMGSALVNGILDFTVPMRDVTTGGTRSFECKVDLMTDSTHVWTTASSMVAVVVAENDAANLMPSTSPPPLETPMVPGTGNLDALPTNLPPPDGFALNDTSYSGFLVVLAAADFAGTEENGRKVLTNENGGIATLSSLRGPMDVKSFYISNPSKNTPVTVTVTTVPPQSSPLVIELQADQGPTLTFPGLIGVSVVTFVPTPLSEQVGNSTVLFNPVLAAAIATNPSSNDTAAGGNAVEPQLPKGRLSSSMAAATPTSFVLDNLNLAKSEQMQSVSSALLVETPPAPAITEAPTATPTATPSAAPTDDASPATAPAPAEAPQAAPSEAPTMAVMSSQAPVPARCGRGSYRAADGCKSCAATGSPFTKFYGGVMCYQSESESQDSTTCGSLVLPAFVRNEYATRSIATCIDPRQEVVNIYLVTASAGARFINSTSYILPSLRLASQLPARRLASGSVMYLSDPTGASRRLVQFEDTAGIIKANKGQTLELTGVIMRSDMLPVCFKSYVRVCNVPRGRAFRIAGRSSAETAAKRAKRKAGAAANARSAGKRASRKPATHS